MTRLWLALLAFGIGASVWLVCYEPPATVSEATRDNTVDWLVPGGYDALAQLAFGLLQAPVLVERSAQMWRYAGRPVAPAESEFIGARLRMLAATRIERRFKVPAGPLASFGIDEHAPHLVIATDTMQLAMTVGGPTPDGFGHYLLSQSTAELLIVPAYQIANLKRLNDGADDR